MSIRNYVTLQESLSLKHCIKKNFFAGIQNICNYNEIVLWMQNYYEVLKYAIF